MLLLVSQCAPAVSNQLDWRIFFRIGWMSSSFKSQLGTAHSIQMLWGQLIDELVKYASIKHTNNHIKCESNCLKNIDRFFSHFDSFMREVNLGFSQKMETNIWTSKNGHINGSCLIITFLYVFSFSRFVLAPHSTNVKMSSVFQWNIWRFDP